MSQKITQYTKILCGINLSRAYFNVNFLTYICLDWGSIKIVLSPTRQFHAVSQISSLATIFILGRAIMLLYLDQSYPKVLVIFTTKIVSLNSFPSREPQGITINKLCRLKSIIYIARFCLVAELR